MPEISLAKTAPLRPFQVDVRDKARVRALLHKLDVRIIGWNIPDLYKRHYIDLDPSLSKEYHYRELLKLIAILISGDNALLVDNPSAQFCENTIDEQLFVTFVCKFVQELKGIVCDLADPTVRFVPDALSYVQGLYGAMNSAVYSKMNVINPATPVITSFILILLANLYVVSFCKTPTDVIVKSFANRVSFSKPR